MYLVLSTDVGGRLGFLLMAAGMTGMLCLLSILWMPLASTADVGPPQLVASPRGDHRATSPARSPSRAWPACRSATWRRPSRRPRTCPTKHWYWPLQSCNDNAWHKIDPSLISDPESESDKILANTAGGVVGPALTSPFSATTDYVYIDGYQKGQNSGCLFAISRHKIYLPLARGAHYVVLRVLPALPVLNLGGAPPPAQPDRSKPYTYVIMERNLGSVRQPQALLAISMGITFLVICYILHTRDKEKEREAEAAAGGPGGGSGGSGAGGGGGPGGSGADREKVGAGV